MTLLLAVIWAAAGYATVRWSEAEVGPYARRWEAFLSGLFWPLLFAFLLVNEQVD